MIEKIPDEKIIPITHKAKIGIVTLPGTNVKIKAILIPDEIKEHYEHLRQHMFDEISTTLRAYHMYEDNALICDIEVADKNFRYIFLVTPEQFNVLAKSQLIVIVTPQENISLFMAPVDGCQIAIKQLGEMMLATEASKVENRKS